MLASEPKRNGFGDGVISNAGTNPIPCPCDFRTTRRPILYQLLMPSGAGLYYSEVALKEYYGRLFYWVKSLIQIPIAR